MANGDVLVLEAQPHGALGPPVAEPQPQVARHGLAVELRHLRPGLLHVAEVREEAPRAGTDDGQPVRARVAREVADVGEAGDQQQVEALLGEPGGDAIGAAHNAALSRSSASRYPSGPWPATVATQTSSSTETARHGSRCLTSERCTSTAGSPVSSTASRSDHA